MSASEPFPLPRLLREAAAHTASGDASLSPELEAASASRLGALALVTASVSAVLGVVGQLAPWTHAGRPELPLAATAVSVALSLALYTAAARAVVSPRRLLVLGLAYQIAQGFVSAVGFYAAALGSGAAIRGWSSVAVWLMVFPLVVPARSGRTIVATLLTAATDPLGLWVSLAAGAPRPPEGDLVRMFLPTLLACLMAPVAARIVYGLTVEVKRAREMGAYRLVEKLGQGGMGEVWRARHRMLAREAAIKLIHPAALGAGDPARAREMVKRFEREAQATAALRSPHTIEVYDYGVATDGSFHYVMELLDGFSLQALVDRFGPVPPERAVSLLRQACHSLAEAHAAGLVHRDVKPGNMFVCRLGLDVDFVKVLDFGLVKLRGPQAQGAEALTVEGAFTGTPGFMPPEIALGTEPVDARADIYALGCVAYWLLTGQRVFGGSNPMQMIIDHVRTPPLPPSRRARQAIPEALERIVLRCLQKDPAARFASASELSEELRRLGLDGLWTEERARAWWRDHPPADGEAGEARAERERESTLSQVQAPALAGLSG